jgi:hypothetical protein
VWRSSLPLARKLELVLLYFGVRKCSTHLVSLGFFCTLVPLTVFTPEVGRRVVTGYRKNWGEGWEAGRGRRLAANISLA